MLRLLRPAVSGLWEPAWVFYLERKFWHLTHVVQHPRETYHKHQKWRHRPDVGDYVVDCRGKVVRVVGFNGTKDDLVFDDGYAASWMHCCDTFRHR